MADVDVTQELPLPVERPRPVTSGPLAWLRANLFNSIPNTILTFAALYLLAVAVPPIRTAARSRARMAAFTERLRVAGAAALALFIA